MNEKNMFSKTNIIVIISLIGMVTGFIMFLYTQFSEVPINPSHIPANHTTSKRFENLTYQEFIDTYLMRGIEECREFRKSCNGGKEEFQLPQQYPFKFDWREFDAVGPVHDQQTCNACWAFSVAGVMESAVAIQYGQNRTYDLSVQQIIDCTHRGGCHSNELVKPFKYLCKKPIRLTYELRYPLTLKDEQCKCKKPHKKRTNKLCRLGAKLKHFKIICNIKETELLAIIANVGPVVAYVNADTWYNYTGGVIQFNCKQSDVNHAVQIVGYDLTEHPAYYIVKNSWGTDFGEDGYARLAFGSNTCGITYQIGFVYV